MNTNELQFDQSHYKTLLRKQTE